MKVMLYLSLNRNRIRLLYLKKTLMGQYENAFYEKKYTIDLLDKDGKVENIDIVASSVKEATSSILEGNIKDKEVSIILPQESFQFFRTEVPTDVAPSAIDSFVKDKAHANMPKELDGYLYDYLIQENDKQKQIIFFALDKELLNRLQEAFSLIDIKIANIIPESLAFFKLFEKTLRKDKKENILYVVYDKESISGQLFDSHGPLDDKSWMETIKKDDSVEELLKDKVTEYEKKGKKINRIILSGENSDQVRQDTFTKNVGAWTNPLKRIIPHFYQDYLKIFIIPSNKTLPLLEYDVCIGAFIFSLESKNFSILKKKNGRISVPKLSSTRINLPMKEIFIFIISFILSFMAFIVVSRLNINTPTENISFFSKPIATPTPIPPSPTPTPPSIDKKELKVKVENGSGVRGQVSTVIGILNEKGYANTLNGQNADNFDYVTTEIQVKKSKAAAADLLKADLKDSVTSPKITTLSEDETADVILITGKDFK